MERIDGICCDICHNFPAICKTKGKVIEVVEGKKRERQKVICSSCAYKLIFGDTINKRKRKRAL